MTTVLPFSNNSITVYKYEPFSYTISNPAYPTVPTTAVSPGIPASLVVTDASKVVFSSAGFGGGTSSNESIVIDVSGLRSSNSVAIAAGRFRDASGNSMSNNAFNFYRNEAITPVVFNASISLVSPLQSYPAFPAGLSFTKTDSNQFTLAGTPLAQTPTSNYQLIGQGSNSDTGKVVTTVISVTVNGERLQLDLSGSPIVSHMLVDTPISQRVLTAKFPLASGPNLRYTWDPLPTGLYFGDVLGLSQASGFQPLDASYTLTLQGTPTVGAAKSFADAGITSYTAGVQALRLTAPNISNTAFFTFQFDPTVLFADTTIPPYYAGITLDPSATFFSAKTYFGSDASISTIFSPDLRSDLSLVFVSNQSRAYLTGTPLTAGTASYTIRASNTLGVNRDLAASIAVSNDSVTITPPVDVCYNFILSRPLVNAKTGYYPSSIQFSAVAASGRPVTFSATGLTGTGLSLSNVSANAVQLVGIPDTVTPLTTLQVTASAVGSPATATASVQFAILNDTITFADVSATSFNWLQNKAITPIQISGTTLSERSITNFSVAGVPSGITITSAGLISGSPDTSGNGVATITGTTGYASQDVSYTYTVRADDVLVALANGTETVTGSFSGVDFRGLAYSGNTPVLSLAPNLQPYQSPTPLALSMTSGGLLSGNLGATSQLLPAYSFDVSATVGTVSTATKALITVSNAPIGRHLILTSLAFDPVRIYARDDYSLTVNSLGALTPNAGFGSWYQVFPGSNDSNIYRSFDGTYDMAQNSNTICAVIGSTVTRSTDAGSTWTFPPVSNVAAGADFSVIATDGGSNWLALGTDSFALPPSNATFVALRQSSNDGASWTDTKISASFLGTSAGQLLYRQGRYILVQPYRRTIEGWPVDYPAIWYADTSNITSWTSVPGPFSSITAPASGIGIATDGTTLVAVGAGPTSGSPNLYKSTDNGTTWADISGTAFSDASGGQANGIAYADGKWGVCGSGGTTQVIYSSDLVSWNELAGTASMAPRTIGFDGNAWIVTGDDGISSSVITPFRIEPAVQTAVSSVNANFYRENRRQLFRVIPNGTPSATFSIPYNPGPYSFVLPTLPTDALFQYVPMTPLPVQLSPAPEFIYYYASQLPRGLVLTPDSNGIAAFIGGTPTQFSDQPTSTLLLARLPNAGYVIAQRVPFRVILPSYQKRTDTASGFTSLLRQYTIVNAAQNARDNRVLPQVDRLLGEFTSPYPSNVITQTVDPRCFDPQCK